MVLRYISSNIATREPYNIPYLDNLGGSPFAEFIFKNDWFIYNFTYMSTKNIALNDEVYRKLARFKDESESFSKAVDRLIDCVATAHTGSDISQRLQDAPAALLDEEYNRMKKVVESNRQLEDWSLHDMS